MTREKRNSLIELDIPSYPDRVVAIAISAYLGDDSEVELDYDELREALPSAYQEEALIDALLEDMYDLGILQLLDFDQGIIGWKK